MHERPMPPHACAEIRKKMCMPPSPQRYNKICINMLTHEKRLDWEMSRECRNGNGYGRRTATHGKTVCGYKNLKSVYTHKNIKKKKKNVESEKIERTCENEKKKYGTKRKNADGDDADERDGNGYVGWRSIRSAGSCDARRTSERRYGEHRARQEADARLQ